jgi:hypothetical protein
VYRLTHGECRPAYNEGFVRHVGRPPGQGGMRQNGSGLHRPYLRTE